VIFFSLSLSLDPRGQSHGDEEKNFDTFEEERDGLSLIRSTEALVVVSPTKSTPKRSL